MGRHLDGLIYRDNDSDIQPMLHMHTSNPNETMLQVVLINKNNQHDCKRDEIPGPNKEQVRTIIFRNQTGLVVRLKKI
jgi:hypothetical protein